MNVLKNKKVILIGIIVLIIIILIILIKVINSKNNEEVLNKTENSSKVDSKELEKVDQKLVSQWREDLESTGKLTEEEIEEEINYLEETYKTPQERLSKELNIVLSENISHFLVLIYQKKYDEAYELLISDYKNAKFNNKDKFINYCKEKFYIDDKITFCQLQEVREIEEYLYYAIGYLQEYKSGTKSKFYVIIHLTEGIKDITKYNIAFDSFVKSDKINKKGQISPNSTITINSIDRYIGQCELTATVKNDTKYNIYVGDKEKRTMQKTGEVYQEDITLSNEKDRNYFARVTSFAKEENYYIIKSGESKKIKFKFDMQYSDFIKNIIFDYIQINGKNYPVEIDVEN